MENKERTDSDQSRGVQGGGSRRRVMSRNMYKEPMVKDNEVGIVFRSKGWTGQGTKIGEKWGQL